MKKYFYSNSNEKNGPLSIDELKKVNINNDTLIWFEGLEDWTPASKIEEIKPILELKPPPIPAFDNESEFENTDEYPQKKETTKKQNGSTVKTKQEMFSSPFSFEGRIRRTEYGISFIIYVIVSLLINDLIESGELPIIIVLAHIPIVWFIWGQGAKRCHDIGNRGWFQIIPFYIFWMPFASGESGINKYGLNPKG